MRVIAGTWRGRLLATPTGAGVRPTGDRVREALFSMLASRLDHGFAGTVALDLFCGTGAFGIEALSRGSSHAVFVDNAGPSLDLVRQSLTRFGALDRAVLLKAEAQRLAPRPVSQAPATLAFADPPYGKGLIAPALIALVQGGWLAPGALIAVEAPGEEVIAVPEGMALLATRRFGKSAVTLMRRD